VTAFHANGKENYGNRSASRKENTNPQFAKRKSPMKETSEQKGYADLKSEFGQMRADISAIMNFLGMSDKKHKSHNDVNKQGKAQASLASTKKSKRSEKKAFPEKVH
jgi:hypothetical protein